MTNDTIVYVIDDDEPVRQALSGLMKVSGFNVQSFASAVDFLASGDLFRIGVVVADLAMPGLTGEELLHRLKAENSPLSVIVVTGVADVRVAVRVMEGGALTLLEKPFSMEEVLSAVRQGMSRSRLQFAEKTQRGTVLQTIASLSDDERAVLARMIEGKSIKASASQLHMSTRTIERRRKSLLEKFGVSSIPELAILVETSQWERSSLP